MFTDASTKFKYGSVISQIVLYSSREANQCPDNLSAFQNGSLRVLIDCSGESLHGPHAHWAHLRDCFTDSHISQLTNFFFAEASPANLIFLSPSDRCITSTDISVAAQAWHAFTNASMVVAAPHISSAHDTPDHRTHFSKWKELDLVAVLVDLVMLVCVRMGWCGQMKKRNRALVSRC